MPTYTDRDLEAEREAAFADEEWTDDDRDAMADGWGEAVTETEVR